MTTFKNSSKLLGLLVISLTTLSGCAATSNTSAPNSSSVAEVASEYEPGVTTTITNQGLVSRDWLEANATDPDLVILHIAAEEGVYERGHIPSARKLDWATGLTGGADRGIVGRASFETVGRDLGINQNSKIVVYGETHQLYATWAVWVFKIYGFNNVRLLDGGLANWEATGGELSLQVPTFSSGDFSPGEPNLNLRAFIEEVVVAAKTGDSDNTLIVDNRSLESYLGEVESGATFDGHVPSAESLFSFSLFTEENTYLDAANIAETYEAIGVTSDKEIILYCGTGLLASASWFALTQVLGFENVKNYDGSWTEYGNAENVPIESAGA
ncbi:sulfurtransferase [Candidatus Aquiluna sp. UB-MaderosW2red]|uniref:sulfurtransferase n=1 Tax=Candidatus Aquiluna sp. UB-MaderosW2red TaxID=1855377 RepID=UPI000875D37E|nr:sulfurtransferase [Candidatus Aquiluna sp. UB-MaderosW2red]SCX02836.1 thiosulfate/3-mercaptopyruvate sulfurtransferase [Candidatus Aquiluna sp. UB-MaderosW2red]